MAVLQRWLWLGIVPIVCGALIALLGLPRTSILPSRQNVPDEKPFTPEKLATSAVHLIGSAGCSARSCHGSIDAGRSSSDPDKCLQNEYVLWTNDRHAEAYRVLFNERSQRIMELLEAGTSRNLKAHEDSRCLACHTNPRLASNIQDDRALRDERLFGVGCESCHGGASKWLVPHTDKAWRKLSPQEKWDKYDMVPVADPTQLAQTCVGCHVGAPANPAKGLPLRDVNHDLIAAGHPRLNFEFGSYLANEPPHWRPRKKAEAHVWAVGQLVSAQAALDLLEERARSGPWPEFAEYDCFSCHHSLAQPSWRQKPGNRRPGSLAWGTWYFSLLREMAVSTPLENLESTMQKPMPDRKLAQEQARAVHQDFQQLHRKFADAKYDEGDSARVMLDRYRKGTLKIEPRWDSAEQLFLALSALNISQPDPAITKLLQELAPIRAFPPGFDGPSTWSVKGRRPFEPDEFFSKLRSLSASPNNSKMP